MSTGIKIQLTIDPATGEQRVPPAVMDLLTRFANHRDVCDDCGLAFKGKTGGYCATGEALLRELCEQPEVSPA